MPRNNNKRARNNTYAKVPRTLFNGKAIRPAYDPPMYNNTPWHTMTVNFEDPFEAGTAYQLKPGAVRSRVLQRFGIAANAAPNFVFKINSIKIWSVGDATSQSPSVTMDVSSLVPTVSDDASPTAPRAVYYGIQAKLTDTGTLNKPAAVGWLYSEMDRSQVITGDQQFNIASYAAGGNGYLRLLMNIQYCFSGVAPPA